MGDVNDVVMLIIETSALLGKKNFFKFNIEIGEQDTLVFEKGCFPYIKNNIYDDKLVYRYDDIKAIRGFKRFIETNMELFDNIEFRIEEAILLNV